MALTADQATKMAPLALAGVVIAGAFAVVAYLAPTGGVPEVEIEPQGAAGGAAQSVNFREGWPESDWPALSDELAKLNHLKAPDADDENGGAATGENGPEGETPPEPNDREPTPVVLGDFKMLGAITSGERVVALIDSGGAQRFVGAGDVVGNYEIRRVAVDHVVIKIDGEERKLELAEASSRELRPDQEFLRNRARQQEIEDQRMRDLRERRERMLQDQPDSGR